MSASWFFGVNILDLDFGFHIDSDKQPVKSNPVGSGHVSHRRTLSFALQRCTTETHFEKNVFEDTKSTSLN